MANLIDSFTKLMTREDLKSFIKAAEHRIEIKSELHKIKELIEIKEIASKYGYIITEKDLQEANSLDEFEKWFIDSKIYPLKKFS